MKRRKCKRIFAGLLAALIICGLGTGNAVQVLAANSSKTSVSVMDVDTSATNGEFRVGMEAGYPPFNWTQMDDSNGAVKIDGGEEFAGGYDVQIAKK